MLEHNTFDYSDNLIYLLKKNQRYSKYEGLIIWDSFNNPIFPISIPKFDNDGTDYSKILNRFQITYSKQKVGFLPWHYCIEYLDDDYVVYNTRPINYEFPLDNESCEDILKSNNIDNIILTPNIENFIHVLIIGDSNLDVYLPSIYLKISKLIISPFSNFIYRYNINTDTMIHTINMGSKFRKSYLKNR